MAEQRLDMCATCGHRPFNFTQTAGHLLRARAVGLVLTRAVGAGGGGRDGLHPSWNGWHGDIPSPPSLIETMPPPTSMPWWEVELSVGLASAVLGYACFMLASWALRHRPDLLHGR